MCSASRLHPPPETHSGTSSWLLATSSRGPLGHVEFKAPRHSLANLLLLLPFPFSVNGITIHPNVPDRNMEATPASTNHQALLTHLLNRPWTLPLLSTPAAALPVQTGVPFSRDSGSSFLLKGLFTSSLVPTQSTTRCYHDSLQRKARYHPASTPPLASHCLRTMSIWSSSRCLGRQLVSLTPGSPHRPLDSIHTYPLQASNLLPTSWVWNVPTTWVNSSVFLRCCLNITFLEAPL